MPITEIQVVCTVIFSLTRFYSIKKPGDKFDFEDLITDKVGLQKTVETALKKHRKLSSNANLEEEGFSLDENGRLSLPTDIRFAPNGIIFSYSFDDIRLGLYSGDNRE